MDRAAYPDDRSSLFALSRTKVLRAKQFIAELEADAADYMETRPLTATLSPIGLNVRYEAITLRPGAIVGDAIHNLRSALDLMACELVRSQGQSDKRVHFPFAEDETGLDYQIKDKRFHLAGDAAVTLLKTFKPFRGGNAALRALHDLDVADKHSGIDLAFSSMEISGNVRFDLTGQTPPQHSAKLTNMRYVFPPSVDPFGGQQVVETLKALVELVESILEAFAPLVPTRG